METFQKKILIDLTPILPGGTNGGSKVFVLDLVKQLIRLRPNIIWILCINSKVIKELSIFESPNVIFHILENTSQKQRNPIVRLVIKMIKKIINNPLTLIKFRLIAFKVYQQFQSFPNALEGNNKEKKLASHNDFDNVDLLFCPFTSPTYIQPDVPVVSIIYDLQFKTYPAFYTAEENYHRDITFKKACHKATKLIAISEYSRLKALEHCPELQLNDIKTIYLSMANRLSSKHFNKKYLTEKSLRENKYIIYPANFWKHKNHEMLITAFQIARHQGLDEEIKLVFTGAPSERQQYLKTITTKFNLSNRLVFLDYVSTDDLASLMYYSLAMIFPSLYEGFGIPLIEAMALDVPIACSNLTSLPEVGADAVLLFDPKKPQEIADSILKITFDEALRQQLISKGKIRAQAFSDTEKMALDYLSIFEDAIINPLDKDSVSGIHVDGWAEAIILLNVEKNILNQHIELSFFSPKWVSETKEIGIITSFSKQYKDEKRNIKLKSGQHELIKIPISATGGKLKIMISPIFTHSFVDPFSKDNNSLTLQVKTCKVVRKNGIEKDLLQEIL